ncbi:hypothetical protein BKA64DRAFT_771606 [Cadophora sp. MPI-SDFR-AT-0126]|nr:hypothetical protein BKA64DRAFT_771606 [Leotiomycetes sp. MPI-SDFR-AT-0126]
MALLSGFTTFFVLLLNYTSAEQPPNFSGDETPYRVVPTGTVSPENILGTWLYGYRDCNKNFNGAKGKIDDAFYDAWRPQIQAVFANTATVIYSDKILFQHYIIVRCDDPGKRCQKRPDLDPCESQLPAPTGAAKPKTTPVAYSLNSNPDSPGYPMINFCAGFSNDRRSMADGIAYGKALVRPNNLRLSNYNNRAQTFLSDQHELFHLDLAARSPDPNPSVDDLVTDIKMSSPNDPFARSITTDAYGTFYTKILARWQGGGGVCSVGYYVQRNSDNLAMYALAKYVMSKNGNLYLSFYI